MFDVIVALSRLHTVSEARALPQRVIHVSFALLSSARTTLTLTASASCNVNDVDLLNSLSRLCDKLTVFHVTLEMEDSGGGRIPACSVLHKCPAWESMAAAHSIMGSNKLMLGYERALPML